MFECQSDVTQCKYSVIFLILWVKKREKEWWKRYFTFPALIVEQKNPNMRLTLLSHVSSPPLAEVSLMSAPRNKYHNTGAFWWCSAHELVNKIPSKPNNNNIEQVKHGGQSGSETFPPETLLPLCHHRESKMNFLYRSCIFSLSPPCSCGIRLDTTYL